MRITENRMLELMSGRTMSTQSSIAKAATQVSTGIAVERPSDDPMRWADGMRTKLTMDRRDAHESTVERARDNLSRTDSAIADLIDGVSAVRDLAMLGATETHNADTRANLAVEVSAWFDTMLAAANVRSIDGEYLLAGTNSDVPPFDTNGVYQGNDVQREIEVDDGVLKRASVTGSWLTAAEGTDIFAAVTDVRTGLEANDPDQVRASLDALTASLSQLSLAQAETGVVAGSLDDSLEVLDGLEVSLTQSFETSVGADPIESATWLANLSNQLEASRVVSERIVQLMSRAG